MPKRKSKLSEELSKKLKPDLQKDEPKSQNITKTSDQNEGVISWTDSDMMELLTKIEENIPDGDSLSYTARLEKINWENISFKSHSTKECQEMWSTLYKQVRKFRLLGEIITDIRTKVLIPKSDPNAQQPIKPKKPQNSYMFFVEDKRLELMNQNPDLSPIDVMKKLGEMFRFLSEEEKQKYIDRAKVAKEEYVLKMQTFYEENPKMTPKRTKRSKPVQVIRDQGPEKPKTPFELFVKVESEKEEADTPRFVIIQKYKELWNEMTDNEKFFWINWAEEQHEKYLQDLKEYIKKHPDYEPEKLRPIITKKEKKIKERCSGKPDRPPRGSYHLFLKMIFDSDDVKNISNKDLMNYVSERWKACSKEEKNEYKIRVDQLWEEYYVKFENYLLTLPPEERDRVREEETLKKRMTPKKDDSTAKVKHTTKITKPEAPPSTVFKYFAEGYKGRKDAATAWKEMTDDEKSVFQEKLQKEKQKYISQYEAYLKTLSREELEKMRLSFGEQKESDDSETETSEEEED